MYGMEALVVTATDRLPPLFVVGNRALDDPGAFGVEHNDAMAVRDMGWLLCWVTTPQEALEHVLIGYRIAEDKRVRMPMGLRWTAPFSPTRNTWSRSHRWRRRRDFCRNTISPSGGSIPTTRSRLRRRPTRIGSWRSAG